MPKLLEKAKSLKGVITHHDFLEISHGPTMRLYFKGTLPCATYSIVVLNPYITTIYVGKLRECYDVLRTFAETRSIAINSTCTKQYIHSVERKADLYEVITDINDRVRYEMVSVLQEQIHDINSSMFSANTKLRNKIERQIEESVKGATYRLRFGLEAPPSKEYSSLSMAKRAHSKRNMPTIECYVERSVEGRTKIIMHWDVELRSWGFV